MSLQPLPRALFGDSAMGAASQNEKGLGPLVGISGPLSIKQEGLPYVSSRLVSSRQEPDIHFPTLYIQQSTKTRDMPI
jgi:hypothetical protein